MVSFCPSVSQKSLRELGLDIFPNPVSALKTIHFSSLAQQLVEPGSYLVLQAWYQSGS